MGEDLQGPTPSWGAKAGHGVWGIESLKEKQPNLTELKTEMHRSIIAGSFKLRPLGSRGFVYKYSN